MKKYKLGALVILILAALFLSVPALAGNGDANVDAGEGGGFNSGTDESYWSGDDGVRITVLRSSGGARVACFDWTNYDEDDVDAFSGQRCKFDYHQGYNLELRFGNYQYFNPDAELPDIITSSGKNNHVD